MKENSGGLPEGITKYVEQILLIKLLAIETNRGRPVSLEEAEESFTGYLSYDGARYEQEILFETDIHNALDALEKDGFVESINDDFADPYYSLTPTGTDRVEYAQRDISTIIGKYSTLGEPWLASVFRNFSKQKNLAPQSTSEPGGDSEASPFHVEHESIEADTPESGADTEYQHDAARTAIQPIPASDRVVELNHNSPEYAEIADALDKVIDDFRKDHRLDNELGQEKPALLQTLEAGRQLLSDTSVRIDSVTTMIVEPLRILARRYEQVLVGASATTALALICRFFGLL